MTQRAWPPASVWLAGPATLGPALGGLIAFASDTPFWWRHVAMFAVVAVGVWACLLAGREYAFVGWVAMSVLSGGLLVVGFAATAGAVLDVCMTGRTTRTRMLGVGVMLNAVLSAAVLWWPATRRWCGLLPAADEGDA